VTAPIDDLRRHAGDDVVVRPPAAADLTDATEPRGLRGHAEAVAEPRTAAGVAAVMRWCYEHDLPIVPRGGGTGYAGGARPTQGGGIG
jgi:FAD/FMN-containing dehydrogenase